MPKILKYDDSLFPRPVYWGKIMMYVNPVWDNLYPFVDIIRILPKDTIIAHKYGKNQDNIRVYGTHYSHNVIGMDLKNKQDYLNELKCVKIIFIFSDTQDTLADNLIKYCENSKTSLVCYSNLDGLYYFYDYSNLGEITKIKDPKQVIEKMEFINAESIANKLQQLFPEFEITESFQVKAESKLSSSLKILKEKQSNKKECYKIPFDANFNKLKYLEASKKKVVYNDEVPSKKFLSNFFKKKD